jgi:ferredoxin
MTSPNYRCLCCENVVLTEPPGSAVICPVCYWRYDGEDAIADLADAQKSYAACGASKEEYRALVRPADELEHLGFEASCIGCGYCTDAEPVQGQYELERGVYLPVRDELAWCAVENALVRAEDLYPVAELAAALAEHEALADIEVEDEVTGILITREHRAKRIDEARIALDWRRRRNSPGRCLSCGTTSVAPLWRDEGPPHPGCPRGGVLRPTLMSSLWMAPAHPPVFSEEGLRLAHSEFE